ncbi:MAG: DUF4143 domain-containing protein [Alphaproteobacteria bacterium]|nr:MAG: DUF4143 domain-containing protein [Alphaproteobacteria bacterium]
MIIVPEIRLVEAHDLLPEEAIAVAVGGLREVEDPRFRFALADLRRRGRYLPALQAPTYDRAAEWIGDQVLPQLPALFDDLPTGMEGPDLWAELARSHAEWSHGIQKRSRMRRDAFDRLVTVSEQQDLLYRLPRWSEPGCERGEGYKLYLTDPGLLHRLLAWDDRMYHSGPSGTGPAQVNRFWQQRDKSWEGFVVSSLIRAAGPGVKATVWEANPGEIDLILDWGRETWAIEVTRGRSKRFREMHGEGHRATGAARPIMLVFDDEVGVPDLRGALRLGHRVECLTVAQALREVRAGP